MKLDKFRRRISKKSAAFDWIPKNTTENIVEKSRNKKVDAPFLIGAGLLLKGYINSINFIKAKVEEAKGEN